MDQTRKLSDLDARLVRGAIANASRLNAEGNHEAAAAAAREALGREPRNPDAIYELAVATCLAGDIDRAISTFGFALSLRPRWGEPHAGIAEALRRSGRLVEARAAIDAAVAIDANDAAFSYARGNILLALGQHHEAMAAYRSVLAVQADHAEAAQALSALASATSDSPSSDYVANHFDRYAPTFEDHLTQKLGYVAPQAIAALLPSGPLGEVLDLGCGTGLVAPALAGRFTAIDGVDLSPRMVELAAAKGLYRELHVAEVGAHLAATAHRYDLVIAADVLLYFGDLEPVFRPIAGCLRPGGRFAFSTETAGSADFELQPTGRFTHSPDYLRRLGALAGLVLESETESVLRQEAGEPVLGRIHVFAMPG